jgi:hypothetical protein
MRGVQLLRLQRLSLLALQRMFIESNSELSDVEKIGRRTLRLLPSCTGGIALSCGG